MPLRNIQIILVSIIICACCFSKTSLKEQIFRFVLKTVEERALEPVGEQELWEGAMFGLTTRLDDLPYSSYLPFEDKIQYENEFEGRFAGIGVARLQKSPNSGEFYFVPLPDSPAARAGLKFGDRLVAVDQTKVFDLSLWDLMEKLRGDEGTSVRLTVRTFQASDRPDPNEIPTDPANASDSDPDSVSRTDPATASEPDSVSRTDPATASEPDPVFRTDPATASASDPDSVSRTDPANVSDPDPSSGSRLRDVVLTRSLIQQEIVTGDSKRPDGSWNFVLENEPSIGYIRIDQFTETTAADFAAALKTLEADSNVRSLVLDLRDNPGGFLPAAVDICDRFLEPGLDIVTTRYRDGSIENRFVATKRAKNGFSIAVLINGDSASASEIVSAAFQDHRRAVVVGTRSYGKGTVQELIPLPCRMGLLHLTVAKFWRPSGVPIHRAKDATDDDAWGVSPDDGFVVPIDSRQATFVAWLRQRRAFVEKTSLDSDLDVATALIDDLNSPTDSESNPVSTEPFRPAGRAPYFDPQLEKGIEYLKSATNDRS